MATNSLRSVTLKPFRSGNSRNLRITIRDKTTKLPIDVTGDKFYFTVKDSLGMDDAAAALQVSAVAPVGTDATGGIAVIPVPSASTAPVEPGSYLYDIVWLKLTSAPGERDTIQEGDVSFSKAVTDAQS